MFFISQNINVVCSKISLYKEVHDLNKKEISSYLEVSIKCDNEEIIRKDQKGLYSNSVNRDIQNVVGVNLPYDKPIHCDVVIDNNVQNNLNEKVEKVLYLIVGEKK